LDDDGRAARVHPILFGIVRGLPYSSLGQEAEIEPRVESDVAFTVRRLL